MQCNAGINMKLVLNANTRYYLLIYIRINLFIIQVYLFHR